MNDDQYMLPFAGYDYVPADDEPPALEHPLDADDPPDEDDDTLTWFKVSESLGLFTLNCLCGAEGTVEGEMDADGDGWGHDLPGARCFVIYNEAHRVYMRVKTAPGRRTVFWCGVPSVSR